VIRHLLAGRPASWVAFALLLLVCGLRVSTVVRLGAPWRDEIHSAIVAGTGAAPLWWDSFPILWNGLLSVWIALVGDSDFSLRLIGLLLSLALCGVSAWAPRWSGASFGWSGLAMLGLSPMVVLFGSQCRGYALGVALGVAMLGLYATIVRGAVSERRWWGTLAVTLLAVQSMYTNSIFCGAGVIGGMAALAVAGRWKELFKLFGVGAVAGLTMLPYLLVVFPALSEWAVIVRSPVGWDRLAGTYLGVLTASGFITAALWVALPAATVLFGAGRTLREFDDASPQGNVPLYAATTCLLGTVFGFAYIKFLSVPTQAWYYMPFLGLWTVCADLGLGAVSWSARARVAWLVLIVAAATIQTAETLRSPGMRMTNLDVVARFIANAAAPTDMVYVKPWYFGLTFDRYYRGAAKWSTIPAMPPEEFIYGYRHMKRAMASREQIDRELSEISRLLQTGGRVWIVGSLGDLYEPGMPLELPPAPESPFGWNEGVYETVWEGRLIEVLKNYGTSLKMYRPGDDQPVNRFENPHVYEVDGARESKKNR
jgi:hypothetical protein